MINGFEKFQSIYRVTLMENLDDFTLGCTPFPFGKKVSIISTLGRKQEILNTTFLFGIPQDIFGEHSHGKNFIINNHGLDFPGSYLP